jgi:adenine deaminase
MKFTVSGNIVDIFEKQIYPGTIYIDNGVVTQIKQEKAQNYSKFILPGFIDSHIHIESSMLSPAEFARNAVRFGTVATISDPHEIANVCGLDGINFMIENGKSVPFKFFFGASSCVPATNFETSGAKITAKDIENLIRNSEVWYLSEMMNFPGVIYEDPEVIAKLNIAKKYSLPVDGHCPGLRGDSLWKYVNSGISTDHECTTIEEAEEKIHFGMKILIREGSAAKNFEELLPLLSKYPDMVMFCSDDLHPYDLINGNINLLVKRAIEKGYELFNVLRAATLNPVLHYKIPVGILRVGNDADFIVVDNLNEFNVLETYIKGNLVAKDCQSLIDKKPSERINNFKRRPINIEDIQLKYNGKKKIRIIEAIDGSLITNESYEDAKIENGFLTADTERDILKITVINRYEDTPPSIGFIRNFGLKRGAIASSVAHDSHNIIAVGTSDELIIKAINKIITNKGGIAYVDENNEIVLPLPIGGLMTDLDIKEVANKYLEIDKKAKEAGSKLTSPLMTISFMSLLVIPSLKIGDKGLFDVNSFSFVDLFVD